MDQAPSTADGPSPWPLWPMLLYGHFGADASPGSRRADRRIRAAIGVFVAVAAALMLLPAGEAAVRRYVMTALVGLLLAYIGWQRWQYAVHLDELTRRLYLESFAITYLAGLTLSAAFALLQGLAGWTIPPLAFVALEPVRAAVLAWRSRRFV